MSEDDIRVFISQLLLRIVLSDRGTWGHLKHCLPGFTMTLLSLNRSDFNRSELKPNGSGDPGAEECEALVDPGFFIHGSLGFAVSSHTWI